MNEYELCVIFSGKQTQDEIDELAKQVDKLLADASAEVKFNHSLGRKKMAYKIKGQAHGEYRCWLFCADSENIPELNEKLRLSQFVIRHLITKFENTTIEDRVAKIKNEKKPTADSTSSADKSDDYADDTDKKEKKPTTDYADRADSTDKKKEEVEDKKEKEEKKPSSKEPKVSLDQLDEKLDELLESDKI